MAHGDHGHGGHDHAGHGGGHDHGDHDHAGHGHGGHDHAGHGGGHGRGGHDHASHDHASHGGGHHHARPADEAPRVHRASAPLHVRVAVITASDTRTPEDDTSGAYLAETLAARGHEVVCRDLVPDEPARVQAAIAAAGKAGAEVVLVTGGTGISRRDTTVEAVEALLERRLPGFGELFRMISFQEIGSAAMLSRATAGCTAEGLLLFALPGSTGACRTALERLILPELGHLVREAKR